MTDRVLLPCGLLPSVKLIGSEAHQVRCQRELADAVVFVDDASLADVLVADETPMAVPNAAILMIGDDEAVSESGADALLRKDYLPRELRLTVRLLAQIAQLRVDQKVADEELRNMVAFVHTDRLTGLSNRQGWESESRNLRPDVFPACLAFLDLDNFKRCNDAVDWSFGDEVLQRVGQVLRAAAGRDVAARWGGDEFALLFRNAASSAVMPRLEQLRQEIAALRFPAHPEIALAASIGCASVSSADQFAAAFAACQQALRQAKARGGNLVLFSDPAAGQ